MLGGCGAQSVGGGRVNDPHDDPRVSRPEAGAVAWQHRVLHVATEAANLSPGTVTVRTWSDWRPGPAARLWFDARAEVCRMTGKGLDEVQVRRVGR